MRDDDGENSGGRNAWLYLAAAIQFTTSPLAGGFVGYLADKYFRPHGRTPIFALLGFVLGFIGGTINLLRILKVPSNPTNSK
jgi:F0F1-type ATP synthase assembly protein I